MAMPFKKIAQMKYLYGINGAEIEKIDSAAAGEIVGACLSYMEAGSTLCETHLQLVYESFKIPNLWYPWRWNQLPSKIFQDCVMPLSDLALKMQVY